jgi:hypothetical protein
MGGDGVRVALRLRITEYYPGLLCMNHTNETFVQNTLAAYSFPSFSDSNV